MSRAGNRKSPRQCLGIGTVIDDPILRRECVVSGVQFPLFCRDILLRIVIHLIVDQFIHDLPKGDQSLDPALHLFVEVYGTHDRVLPEEDLSGYHRIGEVFNIRIRRNRIRHVSEILLRNRLRGVAAPDMGNRLFQLFGELHSGNREHRAFLLSILGALCRQLPQNHLRVIDKIAVQGQALRGLCEVYPVRLNVDGTVTLLQEDDV